MIIGATEPSLGLWWLRADGAGEPQRLLETQRFAGPSSISRAANRVAFHEPGDGTGWDIWTLPFDTS